MVTISDFYAWERHSRDTIDFKMIYVDITGDLAAGLLLSQIIYWFTPDRHGQDKTSIVKNDRRWIAKKYSEWHSEVRLTPDQARRAATILKSKGFVEIEVFKFGGDPTTHFSLNEIEVISAIQRFNTPQTQCSSVLGSSPDRNGPQPRSKWDTAQNDLGSSPEGNGPQPRSITETTAEITAETTAADAREVDALVQEMGKTGIDPITAEGLICSFGLEACKNQLAWLPFRQNVKNVVGFLKWALSTHHPPPPEYLAHQQQADAKSQFAAYLAKAQQAKSVTLASGKIFALTACRPVSNSWVLDLANETGDIIHLPIEQALQHGARLA